MPDTTPNSRSPMSLIKTEHYKIATIFSDMPCYKRIWLPSKKIFDKEGYLAQNTETKAFVVMAKQ